MSKILKSVLLCFLFITTVNSQNINLSQELPQDPLIRKGVLSNGMTYYIQSSDVTKNVASYYIIQNVGSILEKDNQQGLAHFLEHMAFNGTKSFEGKGILNTFQKHGLIFGKDINAYTSFDETVYNINNVPTTPELIDTGLQVLHDWSNYLLLTDEEIDAERGVIKEEWRTRQNGQMRIIEQNIGTMFNHSKYANRLPIGLMDIVDNFEYKALRDFYHDWYRTDLQAIAIIGDVNVDEIEEKIKSQFSKIPAINNPIERIIVSIPDNAEMDFSIAMDKEVATAQLKFSIRKDKSLKNETVADLKESLLNGMVSSMLGARYREVTQNPDAPFLGVRAGYSDQMVRKYGSFDVTITPKPEKQAEAFKTAMTELNRAVKFGFTQSEIDRTINQFSSFYANQIKRSKDRSHGEIAKIFQNNYLENVSMTSPEQEFEFAKVIFKNVTSQDIHTRLKALYTKKNRSLIVTGVEGNENLTKENALSILNEIEMGNSIEPYKDDFAGKTLMNGVNLQKGRIAAIEKNDEIGATTYTLSNGIKVHYKYTNKNENDVSLNAVSDGGKSLIADEDLPSADLLTNLIQMSGIGEFSPTELNKVMAGKTASSSVSIGNLTEGVSGSSVTKDVETMLQLVHLRFVKPRFDPQAWQVLQGGIKNYLISRSQDLKEKIKDSITTTLYGPNNPKKRLFNNDFVEDVSFEKMKQVYNNRFNNAADFEFFIIGDVNEDVLKPLLAKYIASIPTNSINEEWKDNTVNWVNDKIDKDIYMPMENPKSKVVVTIKNRMEYNLKNYFLAKTLGDILQLRYNETLREQEGGTYGASTYAHLTKKPFGQAIAQIQFDCNPEKVEQLVTIVHSELNKIKEGDILQEDLNKTLTNYLKERIDLKNYNSYQMSLLSNYFLEGYNMNKPENFENIINGIKSTDVQEFTKKLMTGAESFEIVFKPKK
ncbi:M16 family metallopeptidase [Lutibacter citreus]|uniref:M16 family metallopeptidase n=1 Tax=Lutibacter citreus TaxID=2138210 RepID=UPI000DBEA45D|nr:insulinase family protein [Lutibacter citreus]